jgi:hypothetical protein
MLKVKVMRETMVKAIEYHALDKAGLTPVIGDDDDLCDWAAWLLAEVSNYDAETLDGAGLLVTAEGGDVVVSIQRGKVGDDVLDAVSTQIE